MSAVILSYFSIPIIITAVLGELLSTSTVNVDGFIIDIILLLLFVILPFIIIILVTHKVATTNFMENHEKLKAFYIIIKILLLLSVTTFTYTHIYLPSFERNQKLAFYFYKQDTKTNLKIVPKKNKIYIWKNVNILFKIYKFDEAIITSDGFEFITSKNQKITLKYRGPKKETDLKDIKKQETLRDALIYFQTNILSDYMYFGIENNFE